MNPTKPSLKTEAVSILFVVSAIVLSFYFFRVFPEKVPTHWNFAGEVDQYSSRAFGAFLLPAMLVGIYALFYFLPYLDPKKERYAQFSKVYHFFKTFIIFFMFVIYLLTGLAALGYKISIGTWVPALVGVLFVFMGNYFGKIKPNWFMGIRTPWTLSSEDVWNKTHRLGGKLFILAGIIMVIIPFLPASWASGLLIGVVAIAALVPMIYSYLLYSKEQKQKTHETHNQQQ